MISPRLPPILLLLGSVALVGEGPRSPPLEPVNVDQDGKLEVEVLFDAGGVGRVEVKDSSNKGASRGETMAR